MGEPGMGESGVVVGMGRTSFFDLNLKKKNQIKVIENLIIFCYSD